MPTSYPCPLFTYCRPLPAVLSRLAIRPLGPSMRIFPLCFYWRDISELHRRHIIQRERPTSSDLKFRPPAWQQPWQPQRSTSSHLTKTIAALLLVNNMTQRPAERCPLSSDIQRLTYPPICFCLQAPPKVSASITQTRSPEYSAAMTGTLRLSKCCSRPLWSP